VTNSHARAWTVFVMDQAQRMLRSEDHRIPGVQSKGDPPITPCTLGVHFDRPERRRVDVDLQLLDRCHEHMAAVRFAPQDCREQADHRLPQDRPALMIPGAVTRDAHFGMSAVRRIPLVDRREPALVDQRLQLCEVEAGKVDRRAALGHDRVIASRALQ